MRNLLKRTRELQVVAKIGGGVVFWRAVVREERQEGLVGKVPEDIFAMFVEAQPVQAPEPAP